MLYFDQFTDFERILTPNDFFIMKIICRRNFYKIFYHPTKPLDVTFLSLFSLFIFVFRGKFMYNTSDSDRFHGQGRYGIQRYFQHILAGRT